MRVAVLGAGNGGVASAFDFAQHGHEVSLYAPAQYSDNTVAIAEATPPLPAPSTATRIGGTLDG